MCADGTLSLISKVGPLEFGSIEVGSIEIRSATGPIRGFWVVVDGRQPTHSEGATLGELADVMIRLGSHDAVNLDGGGSSAFVFAPPAGGDAKALRNKPSDGHFRPVANHLGIVVKNDEKKAVVQ